MNPFVPVTHYSRTCADQTVTHTLHNPQAGQMSRSR